MTGAATGAVLFTDLVGFTEFTDAAGDDAAVAALDVQSAIVAEVLATNPGRVVKELGDGLLIWFDEPHCGVAAAVGLMNALADANRLGRFPLSVRMGLHHGDVVERGDDVVGRTVNVASRVVDLAGPNEILASDELLSACNGQPSDVAVRPIGPATVKGVSEPIWLNRLVIETQNGS